ncbi:flagellin [Henriciella algicola]|uniref:Flagellin n=1 Tax=Henriciella algicola TaxID=1608422 RepID=A0A399RA52_9PROT|nr:flagellin [Henriciella algicola]RIJ27331.1 flagellin [Henriciella algicola]
MSSILTNNSSMVALETLRNINRNLESVQNEISTGKKVASAKDNASVWAISTVMSTDAASFEQISSSLNKGSATVGVARASSEQITSLLQDMKNLIVDAQQDLNDSDRAKIQKDVAAIRSTITNIVNGAQMNGQNLLKGTDDLKVLASLDRDGTGAVAPAFINVSRVDLQATAAVAEADKEATDAGYVSTASTTGSSDIAKDSGDPGTITITGLTGTNIGDGDTATVTLKGGVINEGDVFTFDLGGETITATADADDTLADIAQKLTDDIGTKTITNLGTVSFTAGTDPESDDTTISIAASGGTVALDPADVETTYAQAIIEDGNDVVITFKGGAISEGDTFTVNVGDTDFSYTAKADETINDVLSELAGDIEDAGITNLTVSTTAATDPLTGDATLTLTADGGDVNILTTSLASTNAAVAAGGLGALADIDVSDSAGATAALTSIETLLNKAITAATTFGSAQKQIEGQTEFVQNLVDSMKSGIGAMVDADIEAASAKLQALQVQQQLGVQALSIANSAPQTLLSLFR